MPNQKQQPASVPDINFRAEIIALVLVVVVTTMTIPAAQAQTINVLHSFSGQGDGSMPVAGVTLDRAGNLYGTTRDGGPSTVFKMSHAGSGWILNTLYTFNHPNDPTQVDAGVVFGLTAYFTALVRRRASSIWEPCSPFSRRLRPAKASLARGH